MRDGDGLIHLVDDACFEEAIRDARAAMPSTSPTRGAGP